MRLRTIAPALLAACCCVQPLHAQDVPEATAILSEAAPVEPADADRMAETPVPAPVSCCTVPARTPISIEILEPISSKTAQTRGSFRFRLSAPVEIDGRIVIPAGTPGTGEIVHAAKARFAGKAGELILAARHLDYDGRRIALRTTRFGERQGDDRTNAVLAASFIPIAGMLAPLVGGGEVEVPAGTLASAQIAAEHVLAPVADDPIPSEQKEPQ